MIDATILLQYKGEIPVKPSRECPIGGIYCLERDVRYGFNCIIWQRIPDKHGLVPSYRNVMWAVPAETNPNYGPAYLPLEDLVWAIWEVPDHVMSEILLKAS